MNAKQEYQQYLCSTTGCNKKFTDIALVWLDIGCVLHDIADIEKQLAF